MPKRTKTRETEFIVNRRPFIVLVIMATLTIVCDVSLLWFLFFFLQRVISEVYRPIATKLSHVLESEYNVRNWVRNLGALPVKFGP